MAPSIQQVRRSRNGRGDGTARHRAAPAGSHSDEETDGDEGRVVEPLHNLDREFDLYRSALTAHCRRIVGSQADAEDLVQETYIRARRGIDRFEERSSLKTWLYAIATNVSISALRHNGRRLVALTLDVEGSADRRDTQIASDLETRHRHQTDTDISGIVTQRESVRAAVAFALRLLPRRQRVAFLLCEVLEWPASEVAAELGTSVPAVKSLLQRARHTILSRQPDLACVPSVGIHNETRTIDLFVRALEQRDLAALTTLILQDFSSHEASRSDECDAMAC